MRAGNEKYCEHPNSMEYDDELSCMYGINLEVLVTKPQWAESKQHQQAAHTGGGELPSTHHLAQ